MLSQLLNWKGSVEINGVQYPNIQDATSHFKDITGVVNIKLYPASYKPEKVVGNASQGDNKQVASDNAGLYKIQVKQYMTKKGSPEFDFMTKWNNDNPMPYRIMIGEQVKETKGMVYMKLHADITEKQASICMCCGRPLTNPVSQYFGIGPECGGHNYVNPFDTKEELMQAVQAYRAKLKNIKWEGWIIKSAIVKKEVIK